MRQALEMALEALEKLWNIIDDIDTYGDMAKADEKLYRSLVERRQKTRFEETGITTDGYELSGGAITAIKDALAQPEQEPVAWEQFYPDIGKPQIAINSETVGYVAPQRKIEGPYHVICQCDECKEQLKQDDKCREALDRLAEENKRLGLEY